MSASRYLKSVLTTTIVALLCSNNSYANNTFTIDIPKIKYLNYKKNYAIQSRKLKKKLLQKWDTQEISTNKKWVGYSADLQQKQVIDFEHNSIFLETITTSEKKALKQLPIMLNDIFNKTINDIVVNDIIEKDLPLEKNISKKNKKIKLLDELTKQDQDKLYTQLKNTPLTIVQYKDHTIYKVKLELPKKHIIKRAKRYEKDVLKYSKKYKISPSLIYAIIHSESDFNPVARSFTPAYGLMQIVPRTAGVDAYKFIYKKKRILSSSYLYNTSNNIKLGSAYLHILYYIYFKNIKDKKSRLYCTIAAYNSGAGNVAKSFLKSTNVKRATKIINQLKPQIVYKKLMKNLPFLETKQYLKKVNEKVSLYDHLLKNKWSI
jgi:membrane-bound lytic murein transglycosylase C